MLVKKEDLQKEKKKFHFQTKVPPLKDERALDCPWRSVIWKVKVKVKFPLLATVVVELSFDEVSEDVQQIVVMIHFPLVFLLPDPTMAAAFHGGELPNRPGTSVSHMDDAIVPLLL